MKRRRDATEPAPRITRRGMMLLGLQAGVVGALGWRMRDLQLLQNEHFALLAEENRVNIRLIPPARGQILDRAGRLMAGNRQNYRISMVREQAGDPEAVLARLATIVALPAEAQARALAEMANRSAFVPVVVAEHLTWEDVVRVSANAPVLPGVLPEVGLSRFYPDGPSTSHVIGYVGPVSESDLARLEDPDPLLQIPRFQIGKTGIEAKLEGDLRGAAGTQRIEVSAAGRVMRELGRVEGTPGKDLELTIDLGLQNYAMRRMAGESAAAAVIDVTNGDILALASAPGFDPNSFVFGIKSGEWNALLEDEYHPLNNKTITGTYPPGSTFKVCMALAALEAGVVSPGDGVVLRRLDRARRAALPLLEARRPRPRRPPREPRPVLRLLLLRDGPPPRPRPDQRHGARPRPRHRARPADPGGLGREHAGRRMEESQAQGALDHRRQLQLRHRPGLHPRLADAARADDGSGRERKVGQAAPRRARSTGSRCRSSRPSPSRSPSGACTRCATECSRFRTTAPPAARASPIRP